MTNLPPAPSKHESYKVHQRQVALQILLPLILFLLLLIAGGILITNGGTEQARPWADISAMLLILPVLVVGLVLLVVIIALIVLMFKVLGILPSYSVIAQDFVKQVPQLTRKYANKASEPLIWIKSKLAMAEKFTKRS